MKKALLISYYFPPDPEIGGLRMQGLARYLPEFGWEPIILTKELHEESDSQFRVIQAPSPDDFLLNLLYKYFGSDPVYGVKKKLKINTQKNKKSIRYLFVLSIAEIVTYPDIHKKWKKSLKIIGTDILEKEDIKVIISSSSPIVTHLVANDLKKEFNIPWIADLRDLWSQNHYYKYSFIRKFFEKKLEVKTLTESNAITTVSTYLANDLKKLHGENKVFVAPNGFDPKDIDNSVVDITDKFTITYTGTLYQGKRDPSKLFKAINELISENKIDKNDINIRFYGKQEDWLYKDIEKYNLKDVTNYYGFVSRNLVVTKQRESQLLLLLLWDNPKESGVYTGKIFEYLAAQRPIIAIGPSVGGVVKDLLEETGVGIYTSSIQELKEYLVQCYFEYKTKGRVLYNGRRGQIEKYSQREMARTFARRMDELSR